MANFDAIRFQASRPLLKEISADRLNTVLQEIRRNKPKGERGITVRQTGDGTYIGLAASVPSGSGGVGAAHPFKILFRKDPETEATLIGVTPKSFVYSFFGIQSTLPTGLLSDPSDENDSGWRNASGIKYVWLQFDVDGGTSVQFGTEEDFDPTLVYWDEKSILEHDGVENFPVFVKARRLIAEIVEEDETYTAIQAMKEHQTFTDVVVSGIPAGYFFALGGNLPPET
jgi:hypothetical protein